MVLKYSVMKAAKLIHNPTAGDEEHSKKELISLIREAGFNCVYSSTKKKGWNEIASRIDFLISAGGDGTVRKIVKKLLKKRIPPERLPIGLLPLGTANNIARTLGISGTTEEIIDSWHSANVKPFDVGRVSNLEDTDFFLEGLGYGILPYLMQEMKKRFHSSIEDPDIELKTALSVLHEIVLCYDPGHCELEIDGTNHSGKFLMTEIMNIRSVGPNLLLAPDADPGDGELEIVLVPEKYKDRFATHLTNKIAGKEEEYRYDILKGKKIRIRWSGTHVHVDGEVLKIKESQELKVEVNQGLVQFLVP